MWSEPYLETCCRAALHRLILAGEAGRPAGLKDGRCLDRLVLLSLAERRTEGRYRPSEAGRRRHATEILGEAGVRAASAQRHRLQP